MLIIGLMLVIWFGFGLYADSGALWYLTGIGTLVLILGLQMLFLWRASTNAYPEHSEHSSSFHDGLMTLNGPNGSSEIPLANFDQIWRTGEAVVVRRAKGKSLAALPSELVPVEAMRLFHT
ncbi:hypothetical protein, partial [Corallococcus praedator]|uniref:hypothetical protein n=1 Tax=Corallococcus praedator TaxID=2316724 RepID=UPI0013150C7E